MTIDYAILGLLSWKSLSGYDLKKLFSDSSILYWSGNNNQIYKALIQLHQDGLVSQETQLQESLPAKKIYTITEKGRLALKQWVLSPPALPEFHDTFLIQLTWADLLAPSELDSLLLKYEEEVRVQMLMEQEKADRQSASSARTPREAFLWQSISQKVVSRYEQELAWVQQLRKGLKRFE